MPIYTLCVRILISWWLHRPCPNLVSGKQVKCAKHFVDIKMATYKRLRICISFTLSKNKEEDRRETLQHLALFFPLSFC